MQDTQFFTSWLKGYAQIMLQNSVITGTLFLLGIALNSIPMLLGGLGGGALATLIGTLLHRREALKQGLYGYNGALVGMAGVFFLHISPTSIVLICMCVSLSTLLTHSLLRTPLPGLTAPFVVTTWGMLALAPLLDIAPAVQPALLSDASVLSGAVTGIGQVMFQGSLLSGLCFMLGLVVSSWRPATLALAGSLIGYFSGLLPTFSEPLAANGLYSVNPVLTAIALGVTASASSVFRLAVGIGLAIALTQLFVLIALPALTAPFVLATWSVLWLESRHRDAASVAC